MSESEKLSPCPFCGSDAMITEDNNVECSNCYACIKMTLHVSDDALRKRCIAAWNHRADGWLPIEVAPKDGTVILCYVPHCYYFVGIWSSTKNCFVFDCTRVPAPKQPTHWMPLPPAPKVEKLTKTEIDQVFKENFEDIIA